MPVPSRILTIYLLKIDLNVTLPSSFRSSKWPLYLTIYMNYTRTLLRIRHCQKLGSVFLH